MEYFCLYRILILTFEAKIWLSNGTRSLITSWTICEKLKKCNKPFSVFVLRWNNETLAWTLISPKRIMKTINYFSLTLFHYSAKRVFSTNSILFKSHSPSDNPFPLRWSWWPISNSIPRTPLCRIPPNADRTVSSGGNSAARCYDCTRSTRGPFGLS